MRKSVKKFLERVRFSLLRLLWSNDEASARYLGRTFAVGFAMGAFPFLGQIALVFLIWLVLDKMLHFRFNLLLASLLTFISNPITGPFFLYGFYLTGTFMLGSSATTFTHLMRQLKQVLENFDLSELKGGFGALMHGVGLPIFIGSIPWYFILGGIGYWMGMRIFGRLKFGIHRRNIKRKRLRFPFHKKDDEDDKKN